MLEEAKMALFYVFLKKEDLIFSIKPLLYHEPPRQFEHNASECIDFASDLQKTQTSMSK